MKKNSEIVRDCELWNLVTDMSLNGNHFANKGTKVILLGNSKTRGAEAKVKYQEIEVEIAKKPTVLWVAEYNVKME